MIASDAIYSMSRVAGSHSVVNGESTGCKENLLWICQLELNSGLKQQSLWIGFLVYLQMQMGKFKGFVQVCKWQLNRVLQIIIHWLKKNTEQTCTVFACNSVQITDWLYRKIEFLFKSCMKELFFQIQFTKKNNKRNCSYFNTINMAGSPI